MDSNPRFQSGGTTDSSTSDGHVDDIDAEANFHFPQMFWGQIVIDSMVPLLFQFKESSVNRFFGAFGWIGIL
ncbi:hypothetical protein L6164_023222 [Bauhinia variegata]|uniref:Uncharacterized protein n=1 Tax=Bauhinia variegata TaxID=167791 RepID=A0ACB9MI03_BAUVA|nr:hypothetical protein L6164_023222 [Bauhinia variegata]